MAGMKHFFFDLTTNDKSLYDYRGGEFASFQSAVDFAQEMARMLKRSLSGEWSGWSVEVRNAEGRKFFYCLLGEIWSTRMIRSSWR
jgi:hypothetical protein